MLLFAFTTVLAQQEVWKNYTVANTTIKKGLPAGDADKVIAGKDGEFWFLTYGNGNEKLITKLKDNVATNYSPATIANGELTDLDDINVDRQGNLWVSSRNSLAKLSHGTTDSWTVYNSSNTNNLVNGWIDQFIVSKHSDEIYLEINNKIIKHDLLTNIWSILLEEDESYILLEDSKGNLWLNKANDIIAIGKNGTVITSYTVNAKPPFGLSAAEDTNGNVWFPTALDILNYNTTTNIWSTLDRTNSGAAESSVDGIMVDKAGNLWLYLIDDKYQQVGYSKYNTSTETWTNYPINSPLSNDVRGLTHFIGQADDKTLWGVELLDMNTYTIRLFSYDGVNFKTYDSAETSGENALFGGTALLNGELWFLGDRVRTFDGQNWKEIPKDENVLVNDKFEFGTKLADGKFWFRNGYGISVFDGQNWKIYDGDEIKLRDIFSTFQDKDGNLWLSGRSADDANKRQLVKFDGVNWQVFNEGNTVGISNGYAIDKIFQTKDGSVWFKSAKKLLVYRNQTFKVVYELPTNQFVFISKTIEDKDGNVWASTSESGGVLRFILREGGPIMPSRVANSQSNDQKNWEADSNNNFNTSNILNDVSEASFILGNNNDIWVHSQNRLAKYNGSTWERYYPSNTNNELISSIDRGFMDKSGKLWLYGYEGMSTFDGSTWKKYAANAIFGNSNSYFINAFEDKANHIWAMAFNYNNSKITLSKLDGETWTHYTSDFEVDDEVEELDPILIDEENRMWFTIWGYGLIKFDGEKFTQYTSENTNNELLSNNINHLLLDGNEGLWISTNNGLSHLKFVDSTLPVSLTSFTAKSQGNVALLNWQTASEQNNQAFYIYRRGDDQAFIKIEEVKGKGNSATVSSYQITDRSPLNGNNYYQLVQIDLDGKRTILGERVVNFQLTNSNVEVYPNPTADLATITFPTGLYEHFELLDINGRILQKQTVNKSTSNINISLILYPKGIYLLKLSGNAKQEVKKLIKK